MTPTEQRYSAQEREMLAVVHALKKWRGYIEGSPIVVRTDHESLKYFHTQKHLGRRLARFADDISHFDVQIVYRPGRTQIAADALSRREGHAQIPDTKYQPLYACTNTLNRRGQKIGNDRYMVRSDILFKDIRSDDAAEPQYVVVPTSLADAYELVRRLHVDMGHLQRMPIHQARLNHLAASSPSSPLRRRRNLGL